MWETRAGAHQDAAPCERAHARETDGPLHEAGVDMWVGARADTAGASIRMLAPELNFLALAVPFFICIIGRTNHFGLDCLAYTVVFSNFFKKY